MGKNIITIILSFIICFGVIAFIEVDLNFTQWCGFSRAFYLFLSAIVALLALGIIEDRM